jgi:hypothetical protein
VGCLITQVASFSIKSLTFLSFHAQYCANRAIIRRSSPFFHASFCLGIYDISSLFLYRRSPHHPSVDVASCEAGPRSTALRQLANAMSSENKTIHLTFTIIIPLDSLTAQDFAVWRIYPSVPTELIGVGQLYRQPESLNLLSFMAPLKI